MKRSALVVAGASFALGALFYSTVGQSKPITKIPTNAQLLARIQSLEARSFKPVGTGYELSLNGARNRIRNLIFVGNIHRMNRAIYP